MSGNHSLQGIGTNILVQSYGAGTAQYKADGSLVLTGGGGTVAWANPIQSGVGTNYGLRLTKTSSFPTGGINFSLATGVVWDLSVDRLISAVGGAGDVTGTLEITNLAGTVVYSTSTITISNMI